VAQALDSAHSWHLRMKKIEILVALWIVGCTTQIATAQGGNLQSNLPLVVIQTQGETIVNEPKVMARMGIVDNGSGQINATTDSFNGYNGWIGIEYRGSSSQAVYPKKPYSIELRNELGEDLDAPLLGMPAHEDWALIMPYNDKTFMRDWIAHCLGGTALDWSPRSRYVELVLDGEYQGIYLLIETIRRGNDRVDIARLKTDDIDGVQRTGGYVLRMDKYGESGGFGGDFPSNYPPIAGSWQQTYFQYHYPKADAIQPEQAEYIQGFMTNFEDMMASPNYQSNYANWLDIDSWINYLLVQEVAKNVDGYRLSAYFYKDREDIDPRLKMGPLWDFNIGFGIGDYCDGALVTGWAKDFNNICGSDTWVIHFWWEKLWNDPVFRQKLSERYTQLRAGVWQTDQLMSKIDSIRLLLEDASTRNFNKWPALGNYIWPNAFVGQTFDSEVDYLKLWLEQRLQWLDEELILVNDLDYTTAQPFHIYPNPTQGAITLAFNRGGRLKANIDISFFDLLGRLIYTIDAIDLKGKIPYQLPRSAFPTGSYYYRVRDSGGTWIGAGKLAVH
jgi:CotH kinase protein/Secretion system C-terminal sorting domain